MDTDPTPIQTATVTDGLQLASWLMEVTSTTVSFAAIGAIALFVAIASVISWLVFCGIRPVVLVAMEFRRHFSGA